MYNQPALTAMSKEGAKIAFLKIVYRWPTFGSSFFEAEVQRFFFFLYNFGFTHIHRCVLAPIHSTLSRAPSAKSQACYSSGIRNHDLFNFRAAILKPS